ncbi:diphosphomevalonate decarboxylase [Gulosibacter molinativorax]|uniref:diphosphomevalonate decarboxylase n=1 Tax=Gulosibacter molinativorax TaxID=256821 RepID=A0ABT7C982_9MICO|nr:diphosphomevalonate decarboxylase [Gulosibacter molinativorax]MDJ1371668.1 diphosphomevalonate decarboxylase [Gulosibacter molinativorax]QUY63090.1 Mevalonate diphosphate decarboxylase [Gulosibacter molinativorax]
MTTATARAYPNIALVKYWGKRDSTLMLPLTGSMSMTLDDFPTVTTVERQPDASADTFELGGEVVTDEPLRRVAEFLDLVRERSGVREFAAVRSKNEGPTAAGLASSASGFAALALATSKAYGLSLEPADVSRLARRGSGSATRSIIPHFAVWRAGDDETSVAEAIDAPDMRMIVVVVQARQKEVSSREAMKRTAATSPYHQGWITTTEEALESMIEACADGDFTRIGRITETNAMRMHAAIQACDPPIRYLAPQSIAIFDRIRALRDAGMETYGTADAGPNVVAISRPEDADAVAKALAEFGEVRVMAPGPGAELLADSEAQ